MGRPRETRAARAGQMSVEAAVLLPTVLLLVGILVQPACLLYTRMVMTATAGELTRLVATGGCDDDEVEAFALRRLAAVPDLAIFCEGGEDGWDVSFEGPDDDGVVSVTISCRVSPLPLLGVLTAALGEVEDGCVVLTVEVKETVRSSWIGGSYEEWVKIWG